MMLAWFAKESKEYALVNKWKRETSSQSIGLVGGRWLLLFCCTAVCSTD